MDRFVGEVAVVTGSSFGIGEAIAKELVKRGLIVVGLDRKMEKLQKLSNELRLQNSNNKFYGFRCDLTVEEDIQKTFHMIVTTIGPISILVNNAGVTCYSNMEDINGDDIDGIYNTNVKGFILASKETINSMNSNPAGGHIVNISSVLGVKVSPIENAIVYTGSKHAVTAFSESLRLMTANKKSNIKITNLSPGMVNTEMTRQNPASSGLLENHGTSLRAEDVANACVAVLDTPPSVLISELTLLPIHSVI